MKDMFECLYERASAHGNRPLTGNDLARIVDEAKREFRKQKPEPADAAREDRFPWADLPAKSGGVF